MSKFIVFCADGTWNGPGQDDNDNDNDPVTCSNVFKLFLSLSGHLSVATMLKANEQEKELRDTNNNLLQISKYIHGIGDSCTPIRKLIGGATGAGIISRIVRGYTFISRNYEKDDHIVLVGFSRGAYTARAIAGLIASQGLLNKNLTKDHNDAYRWGAKAWYAYRKKSNNSSILAWLPQIVEDLPAFLSCGEISSADLVPVAHIKAVAVWDTVGALGIPRYHDETPIDVYKFTDTNLSPIVEHGLHAISLDEQRLDFTPTFWTKSINTHQVLFPGAHADVGGGYPMEHNESGLSDISLVWMIDQLRGIGVRFLDQNKWGYSCVPDVGGIAHEPWLHYPFNNKNKIKPRDFTEASVDLHASILQRMNLQTPILDLQGKSILYNPINLPPS